MEKSSWAHTRQQQLYIQTFCSHTQSGVRAALAAKEKTAAAEEKAAGKKTHGTMLAFLKLYMYTLYMYMYMYMYDCDVCVARLCCRVNCGVSCMKVRLKEVKTVKTSSPLVGFAPAAGGLLPPDPPFGDKGQSGPGVQGQCARRGVLR